MKKCMLGWSLLLICACQSNENESDILQPQERKDIELIGSELKMLEEGNNFAIDLMKALEQNEEKDNYFISPLSASLALSMVTNGAANTTLAEMKQMLGFGAYSMEEMNAFYKKMTTGLLAVDNSTQLGIANSIWIREGFPVYDSFKTVNRNMYDAEVRDLDFRSPQAVPTINQWCANKTNNRINEVIKEITDDMYMFLINALYFKGTWKARFDKANTAPADFTNKDGSKSRVDMMKQGCTLAYTSEDGLQIAEFPYGNEAFSMVVLLPTDNATPEQVIAGLTSEKWSQWMKQLSQSKEMLDIRFPKFKMEYERELSDDLKMLGMKEAFIGGVADFSQISLEKLYVGFVKQNTFVEVNEEGTEAAAVTVVGEVLTSAGNPQPVPFYMDRPFVYVIKEKSTGAILFMGKMGSMK